ncbi:hypothetical protein RD792_009130 [Penstemon davidsonii]|uniref:CASP-like protein n=1 Tax=Penstemon davidsonii TaxID=160366 RepID=A0ABR0DBA3_9LAMI|nr:hypothetical protein RD792_009130 [Penstemon davidsonii]
MSGYTISPAQPPLPTPSPFSYSVASTRWNSSPSIHTANLYLRFLALVLSFGSALSLAVLSPTETKFKKHPTSFLDYPQLLYCFTANIMVFLYAAYQLFKGICDIALRGIFISDKVSDYISFIFDHLAGYVLISASSVAVQTIQQMDNGNALWKAALVSVCMSFTTFLVIAASALLSGYKFCKRIIW